MILKKYGSAMQSVALNFDSKALNEIGFRRDHEHSIPTDEFESGWTQLSVHELDTSDEGDVQDETEQKLLDHLESEIRNLLDALQDGEVLVVENENGVDWPKTKHKQRVVVDGIENRLHFTAWVEPPLRIGRYRKG